MSLRGPSAGTTPIDRDDAQGGRDGTGSGSNTDPGDGLSDSDVFDILRNSRRRAVLRYLLRDGGDASLRELTDHVAAQEYDVEVEELSPDQRKRVYTGLYQCHLPRLDEFGVVDFEADEKAVTLRDRVSSVERYLARDDRTGAARVELFVAVLVALLVTPGVFGVGPLGALPPTSWAILTVLALVGLAAVQLRDRGLRSEY